MSAAAPGIKQRMAEMEAFEEAAREDRGDEEESSSSFRPRRVVRQRAQAAEGEVDLGREGPLFKRLKTRWAQGKLPADELQRLAFDAVGQGAQGMDGMAALGNAGENPRNCFRALKRLL